VVLRSPSVFTSSIKHFHEELIRRRCSELQIDLPSELLDTRNGAYSGPGFVSSDIVNEAPTPLFPVNLKGTQSFQTTNSYIQTPNLTVASKKLICQPSAHQVVTFTISRSDVMPMHELVRARRFSLWQRSPDVEPLPPAAVRGSRRREDLDYEGANPKRQTAVMKR
jgi:hypothetical protein